MLFPHVLSTFVCLLYITQTTDEAFSSTSATKHPSESGKSLQRPSSPAIQNATNPNYPKPPPPRPPPPARASTLPKRNSSNEGEIIIDFPTKNDEAVKPSEKPKPAPRTKLPNANPFLQSDGAPVIPPKPKNPFLDDMDENETENSSVNPFTKSGETETSFSNEMEEDEKSSKKDETLDHKPKVTKTPSSPKAKGQTTKKTEAGNPPKVVIVSFLILFRSKYSCLSPALPH